MVRCTFKAGLFLMGAFILCLGAIQNGPAQNCEGHDLPAWIKVSLPADAQVFFGDVEQEGKWHPTRQRGTLRTFISPSIPCGSQYFYDIRAVRRQDGKTLENIIRLMVLAGHQHSVAFQEADFLPPLPIPED